MRILVVEDDPNMLKIIEKMFREQNVELTVATTLQQAFDIIANGPEHDVLTLDLALTDSGVENTLNQVEAIRKTHPKALLIILTGMVIPTHLKDRAAHADIVFNKLDIITTGFWKNIKETLHSLMGRPGFQQKDNAINVGLMYAMAVKKFSRSQKV